MSYDFSTPEKTWSRQQRAEYQRIIHDTYEDAASKVKVEKLCVNENGATTGPKDMGCVCRHCTGARAVQEKEKELIAPPAKN